MFGIGAGELIMILIAGLVIFGPGKLPEVGRAIGKGLREFRKAQAMFRATLDEVDLENKEKIVELEKKSSAENVSTDKAVTTDKTVVAEKSVSLEKTVTVDKAVTLDQNITADNPAENISREKIIDAANKIYEEKQTAVSVDDVIQMAKDTSLSKPEDDKTTNENSADKNTSTTYKNSVEKKTALNVYDVIEMSKNNTFVKEKVHEKIFGGNGAVTYNADVSKCINIARGGTDGTGK